MSETRRWNISTFLTRVVPLLVFALLAPTILAAQEKNDVTLTAPDGIKLKATYYPAAKPGPGILLLHMCNSRRTAWDALATDLSHRGYHVLTMDYRGYGESEGRIPDDPAQRQAMVDQQWPGDIDAAFAHLVAQPGVDRARIAAGGGSCGVNQAVQLARRHPEVKSLVLLSGTTDKQGREYLQKSAWLPVFASASEDDGDAVSLMRWLLAFSRHPGNQFVLFQKAGHGTDMFAVEPELQPRIAGWFESTLGNAPARTVAASTARPKPSAAEEFWSVLDQPGGAARARQMFAEARRRDPNVFLFPEAPVNQLGYERLQAGNTPDAIEIFLLNVAAYPRSANVYDSLADAYDAAGNRELAIQNSEMALQMLKENPPANAQQADAVRQSAEGKIARLKSTGSSPPSSAQPPPPPFEELFRMPIVLSIPGMDKVNVREDVVYKSVQGSSSPLQLEFDAYIPAGASASQRFPAVILISGGGVDNPDWRKAGVYQSYGRLLAASGMVGIAFQKRYERSAEGLRTGSEDTADLIRYVREHAPDYGIDPDRLAAWAFSAGGPMLASSIGDAPPYIRGVISFYAAMDAMPSTPEDIRQQMRSTYSDVEALKRSGSKPPAFFIGRAGLDNPGLNSTIDSFVREALAHNATIEVMNHPNGRHGFDILDKDDRSREIIGRAIEFLRSRFGLVKP